TVSDTCHLPREVRETVPRTIRAAGPIFVPLQVEHGACSRSPVALLSLSTGLSCPVFLSALNARPDWAQLRQGTPGFCRRRSSLRVDSCVFTAPILGSLTW